MSVEWSDPSSRDFETQHSAPRLQCNNTGILVGHQLAFMTSCLANSCRHSSISCLASISHEVWLLIS